MIFLQTLSIGYPHPQVADENVSPKVLAFIEQWTKFDELDHFFPRRTHTLVKNGTHYDIDPVGNNVDSIVLTERLNDIRYINKFLESMNQKLQLGGRFIGCVETSGQRERRLKEKLSFPINKLYYHIDYVTFRVLPKLPHIKRVYFGLTRGKNRVISEMETYGRLYCCGFKLLDSKEIDGKLYFTAEKTGDPNFDTGATYGPVIKLNRVGKGGKVFKFYKFRTMYPYSEYLQQYIYERNGLGDGAKFKDDPRVNRMGKFMRKWWIDEIPMLLNFIKGDMKLFGVRPISRQFHSLYPEEFQVYRNSFKPGLIPPVYVEIPNSIEDTVDIERRYLEAYEKQPFLTDLRYTRRALYNIFFKKVRSK